MELLSTSELIAAMAFILSLVVFFVSVRKDSRGDSARDQMINDKLNQNIELAKETRDTVRELSKSLNDHSTVLARHTEQIATLFNRVEKVEARCERHFGEPQGKDEP